MSLTQSLIMLVIAFTIRLDDDPNLLGTWNGSGQSNRGETLLVEKGFVTVNGKRMSLRIVRAGVLSIGLPGQQKEFNYEVKGDELIVSTNAGTETYKRAANDKPPENNPLGGVPVDPFVRKFEGDGLKLDLSGSIAGGYTGKLTFRGTEYPAEAKSPNGTSLTGRFNSQSNWFKFSADRVNDSLTLESGGKTYKLVGEALKPAVEPNPLGEGEQVQPTVTELQGVDQGEATRFEHPRGWFSFDMPDRWSVAQQMDDSMILNPGLQATDILEAIVGMFWGRLESADQGMPVGKVLEKHTPTFRQYLAQQGLQVGDPEGPAVLVRCKDVPGAVLQFEGKTIQGQPLRIWLGTLVKRDYWLTVMGIFLGGKEESYLPKVKRVFVSLEPKPPERNAKLEAALVGKTFTTSSYGKVTGSAFHASYAFHPDGVVVRTLMSNIPSTPGLPGASADAERTGRYEVAGDVVYLFLETGQEVGQVIVEGAQAVGIRIGSAEYR